MEFVQFIQMYGRMHELMLEPAWVFSNEVVVRTETETATFLWDSADEDSDVVLTRTTTYDAANLKVSSTVWSLSNAPTVSDVETDQTPDSEISLSGTTVLTITGTNFGEEDTDIKVFVYVQPAKNHNGPGPTPGNSRFVIEATITNIDVADQVITASLDLPRVHGAKNAAKGQCELAVQNVKRHLASTPFTALTVV